MKKFLMKTLVFGEVVNQSMKALLVLGMVIASVHAQKSSPPLPASAAPVPLLSAQVQIFYNLYEKAEVNSAFTQEEQEQMSKALDDILKNQKDELPAPTVHSLVRIKEDLLTVIPEKRALLIEDNRALFEILKFHHIMAANILLGQNFIDVGSLLFDLLSKAYLLRMYSFFFHTTLQNFVDNDLAFEDKKFFDQRQKELLGLIDFENNLVKEVEALGQQLIEKLHSRDELKGAQEVFGQEYQKIVVAIASFKEQQVLREKAIKEVEWTKKNPF